jgi:uncharacterized membrane protein
MKEVNEELQKLREKLAELEKKQEEFGSEILSLGKQIRVFEGRDPEFEIRDSGSGIRDSGYEIQDSIPDIQHPASGIQQPDIRQPASSIQEPASITQPPADPFRDIPQEEEKIPAYRQNLEKFIGEKLISKIGIVITVIGAAIGVKYAIDHELIGFWTRIILGYLLGAGLLGFALKLKKDYLNFSATLFSGSMAVFYFITFAAYSFYSLIPMPVAFALMVLFTVVTVAAALVYDRQVISLIGLVGAYAVPFLVSSDPGKAAVLFTYISLINAGILFIAFRKQWKYLFYAAFLFTWAIFITWYLPSYDSENHFTIAVVFLVLFFLMFYAMTLAGTLVRKEKFDLDDIVLLLLNSIVFYSLGISVLHAHLVGVDYKGWFTLGNAAVHFGVCVLSGRVKDPDEGLVAWLTATTIAFITLAIPVQLGRNWVSMLWSVEAAVLFHVGRKKQLVLYEVLSWPLMILAFISLTASWPDLYHSRGDWPAGESILPLFNPNFPATIVFLSSFVWILRLKTRFAPALWLGEKWELMNITGFLIPAMLLSVIYFSLFIEINTFWKQSVLISDTASSGIQGIFSKLGEDNAARFRGLSLFAWSFLFLSVLGWVNIRRIKNSLLGLINLGFDVAATGLFMTLGLIAIGGLRESFLSDTDTWHGITLISVRYLSFLFLALTIWTVYLYSRQEFLGVSLRMEFDLFFHICLLTAASNELINWMDIAGSETSYKLGLSILFGVYALLLIVLGIWKKKLHLRIAAIVLFSGTLLKLFFYDLSALSTIGKTIVFLILGILLLIISFLYNKYRHVIFDDKKDPQD